MTLPFSPWPPGYPAQSVTFAAVKAALAQANAPVGFNSQRLASIGAPLADGDAVNRLYSDGGSWRGAAIDLARMPRFGPATLNAGGSLVIPGPAAGLIRVIGYVVVTSNGATPSYNLTLSPSGLFLGRAVSGGAGTAASVTLCNLASFALAIGNGESLVLDNIGSASAQVVYAYFDIPSAARTLVRVPFGAAPVEVMPAAAAGTYHRWVVISRPCSSNTFITPNIQATAFVFNDDTAGVQPQLSRAGVLMARGAAVPANGAATQGVIGIDAGSGEVEALTISAVAAVATRNANFIGCYETFSGNP